MKNLISVFEGVKRFEKEAHLLLSYDETSLSRVINLNSSYLKLKGLSVTQKDMLRQSLRCVEVEVFRAAHVLAWAACVDYLVDLASMDSFKGLNAARVKWKILSKDDLFERFTEFSIIDAMKEAKLISKSGEKAFKGLLSKRNECAHPSAYYPDLNQSLGYISEILSRIESLESKKPTPSV